jgi:hypothetical protein
VLFTSGTNDDLKLLRFMADKTAEEAGLEGEERTALLKAKYSQIDAIHRLATKRETCPRAASSAISRNNRRNIESHWVCASSNGSS